MVRRIEAMSSSPTSSIDSIASASAVASLCDLEQHSHSGNKDDLNSHDANSSSSSGLGHSPAVFTLGTKCSMCNNTYRDPKVLNCLHSFCKECLEKNQDGQMVSCPQCHVNTSLSVSGVDGLLSDFGALGLIETEISGSTDYQAVSCSSCRGQDLHAVARCLTCSHFLCPNCVTAHQYMHCFENHDVISIGELVSNEKSGNRIQQLDSFNRMIQDGRQKTCEILDKMKSLSTGESNLASHFSSTKNFIDETFQMYMAALEERKTELMHELETDFASKKIAMSVYNTKGQEVVEQLQQMTDFIERLLKNATNSQALQFKSAIEHKFASLLSSCPEMNLEELSDFKFVSNFSEFKSSLRNNFGYIRSKNVRSCNGNVIGSMMKQPPISRPTGYACSTPGNASNKLNSTIAQTIANLASPTAPPLKTLSDPHQALKGLLLEGQRQQQQSLLSSLCLGSSLSSANSMFDNGLMSKRLNSNFGPLLANLGSLGAGNGNGANPWNQQMSLSTNDSIVDQIPTKYTQPGFPPKSQIKRQKMIYHCKFGEFGVLEGQFTEPSGVAVNAQNDIIVADTNNHRIQIFDKEGRFKFQFGECGKKDGQLLYPNRVAVIKSSGDIIVTERSPTHQFGCSKHLEFPNGVVTNDREEVFISDNRAHCVKVFSYTGIFLRQIGGEGVTNYPIGVGINAAGEILIADNHNNFNLTVFSQDGQILSALESKVKHAQCFDVSLMDDGSAVLASKDYRLYIYRYIQIPQMIL